MSLAEKARPDGVLRSKPGPAGQYVDLPRQGVTPRRPLLPHQPQDIIRCGGLSIETVPSKKRLLWQALGCLG